MNLRPPKLSARAFTLIELLVVLAIIGLLAAAGLPAIRGMNKSNALIASNRQFQDDVSYARQRAIADHTSVYVVFVPPTIINYTPAAPASSDRALMTQYTNLLGGQYTTYALISMRLVGEQPGRATPHYLTDWRSLPPGVFFAEANFAQGPTPGHNPYDTTTSPPTPPKDPNAFPTANFFPYPNATNFPGIDLPYIGFNYLGQLIYADGTANGTPRNTDVYIPLARGSIFYQRTATGSPIAAAPSVQESPAGNSTNTSANVVRLNALTGRARIETASLP